MTHASIRAYAKISRFHADTSIKIESKKEKRKRKILTHVLTQTGVTGMIQHSYELTQRSAFLPPC